MNHLLRLLIKCRYIFLHSIESYMAPIDASRMGITGLVLCVYCKIIKTTILRHNVA
jgi:hypothetical protein